MLWRRRRNKPPLGGLAPSAPSPLTPSTPRDASPAPRSRSAAPAESAEAPSSPSARVSPPPPTMNRSLQSRATGRATISGDLGHLRRQRLLSRQAPGEHLGDPISTHRDPVQPVGCLHRALLMGDDDELRAL